MKKQVLFFTIFCINSLLSWSKKQECWPWEVININSITLPKAFKIGTAICEFQNSGNKCKESTWNQWQNSNDSKGNPRIKDGQKSGTSCDFWNKYPEDIDLMKKNGLKSLRFSVDWAIIEPQKGQFDENGIKHYVDLCDELIKADIEPMITLHHFNHPIWFEDMGGFEKEANIYYFLRFCEKIFANLGSKVKLWCTINEPTIYAFQGYLRGVFPPGKSSYFQSFEVLKNLMMAHVVVYNQLKKMAGGKEASIGLAHQHLQFFPYNFYNPIENIACIAINKLLTDVVYNFYKTGEFNFSIPGIKTVYYKTKSEKILDFMGINYYSRVLIHQTGLFNVISDKRPHEIMTDMPYPIYAEGLYHAIAKFSELKVPMYITETGIADAIGDRRNICYKKYFYAISESIKDGFDVKGCYIWTWKDNFEWDEGWHPKFGLFTRDGILKKESEEFINFIKNHGVAAA